jgi:sterol desaturase/sphingolipid hydroxylase (fatty acid hydroxylase superfamily)
VQSREIKTLAEARQAFTAKRSPKLIAAGIVAAVAARAVLGAPTWRDAVAVVGMLVVYPLGEWAIHVYLLHLKPFRWRGRRVDLPTARAHREHHEAPNDLGLILLAPLEVALLMLVAVPAVVGVGGLLVGLAVPGTVPLGALATAAVAAYVLIGTYEWTHFLIHTAYRPRSRYFRSIWRSHRLHHFKNEHYWHGITTNVSDRVLGTFPDQRSVPRSRTARALDVGPAS